MSSDIAAQADTVLVERNVQIVMRDGVNLAADVYRPSLREQPESNPSPTVLVRTTYDKAAPGSSIDPYLFVSRGYNVVIQDVRGRYGSEGTFYHGIHETEDGYDTLAWIGSQRWSNGRVGMTGISYLAAVQCAAACSGSQHLKSMFHTKAPQSYYLSGFRNGGNFMLYVVPITFMFACTSKEARADPVLAASLADAFAAAPQWLSRLPIKKGLNPLNRTPDIEEWLFDAMTQETYDDFWKRVRLWQPIEYIDEYTDVPGYYVGGWYDIYREETFYETLVTCKRGPIKLLMGPWTHSDFDRCSGDVDFGPTAELTDEQYFELQLEWFDATLRDRDLESALLNEPPVKIFVMGGGDGRRTSSNRLNHGGTWRLENEWPLARATATKYHFHADGLLSSDSPCADAAPATYVFDPTDPVPTIGGSSYFVEHWDPSTGELSVFVPEGGQDQRERLDAFGCASELPLASRHDVLVFETPPLPAPVEVTGTPVVNLWISSTAVDTDFTAKLIDVYPPNEDYPEGYALNLGDGIIRARYRQSYEVLATHGTRVDILLSDQVERDEQSLRCGAQDQSRYLEQ